MQITLTEPTNSRYIYINTETNQVHLLVPLVAGQEISTDNTCKSTQELSDFSSGAAVKALYAYKSAVEFDLLFLEEGSPLRAAKQARLAQVDAYLNALPSMDGKYLRAITSMLEVPSNLFSIQLRPFAQDNLSRVVAPIFNVKRTIDSNGTPTSVLYNEMYLNYPKVTSARLDPKSQLDRSILGAHPDNDLPFESIQVQMKDQCNHLFGVEVDFTKAENNRLVTQESIDTLMGFSADMPATTKDYIDALWGTCAPKLVTGLSTPPFYREFNNETKTEFLSILTQFFLGIANSYCAAKGIANTNFGVILDDSPDLSKELVANVSEALTEGAPVEERIFNFFNKHTAELGFIRQLTQADINAIQQKFERTYSTVTATKENPHMDDFMILELDKPTGQFVTHQGSICTDFVELLDPSLDNATFQTIREDFRAMSKARNFNEIEHHQPSVEVSMETLLSSIRDDEQFDKLPMNIKVACLKSPTYQFHVFLTCTARGKQEDAKNFLTNNLERIQEWLLSPGKFTDYSGRTFNCTAYEYAYWAKDTHMCRMLEQQMDPQTKEAMGVRIDSLEQNGLTYEQRGNVIEHSKHFDFTPLKTAMHHYVTNFKPLWRKEAGLGATVEDDHVPPPKVLTTAWLEVGRQQQELPVHVINEYCRKDGSFNTAEFNEEELPRDVIFRNKNNYNMESFFPLDFSSSSIPGVHFALRPNAGLGENIIGPGGRLRQDVFPESVAKDLSAIVRLDEVRTAELRQLHDNLMVKTDRSLGKP